MRAVFDLRARRAFAFALSERALQAARRGLLAQSPPPVSAQQSERCVHSRAPPRQAAVAAISRRSPLPMPTLTRLQAAKMVRISVLNDTLKSMYNAEKRGKVRAPPSPPAPAAPLAPAARLPRAPPCRRHERMLTPSQKQVLVRPVSKVVIKFLQVMQKHGYIGEFELIDDHRAGKIVVELNGRINKCGCIRCAGGRDPETLKAAPAHARRRLSPRYDIGHNEIEAWVGRVLPSRLVRARPPLWTSAVSGPRVARACAPHRSSSGLPLAVALRCSPQRGWSRSQTQP